MKCLFHSLLLIHTETNIVYNELIITRYVIGHYLVTDEDFSCLVCCDYQ